MTDLTKITTPFGLLDEETQQAMVDDKGPFETYDSNYGWIPPTSGYKKFHKGLTYRKANRPIKQPVIPWEHLADHILYVAKDDIGGAWGYSETPVEMLTVWDTRSMNSRFELNILKIDWGDVTWNNSLIKRPEEK